MNQIQIDKIVQTKNEVIRFINTLNNKLKEKEITKIDYYSELDKKLGTTNTKELLEKINKKITNLKEKHSHKEKTKQKKKENQRTKLSIAAAFLFMSLMIGLIITSNPQITGNVILDTENTISTNKEITGIETIFLNQTNITGIKIIGEIKGSYAKITANINGEKQLVGEINIEPQIYTLKDQYSTNEEINIQTYPELENKSYYLDFENNIKTIEEEFTTNKTGEYKIIVLGNLNQETIRLEKTIQIENNTNETTENPIPTKTFTNLCEETCNINQSNNITITIETNNQSSIIIEEIIINQQRNQEQTTENNQTNTTIQENRKPVQIKQIKDLEIQINQTKEINLSQYFIDPEEQRLLYETNELIILETQIQNEIIEFKAKEKGKTLVYFYVTDGEDLLVSDTFNIEVYEEIAEANQTNTTQESATAEQVTENNTTNNVTNSTINTTKNITTSCDNTDPNLRPPECIQGKEQEYFVLENVFLEYNDRSKAARITPLGNMIITGEVIENSNINSQTEDFKVTRVNSLFEEETIAWIDKDTGSIHLVGELVEEDFFLKPTNNAFVIQNKRNVNLAYIDRNTGDLHLKGNIIQKEELTK
jgi:hypothetical protein